MRDADFYRERGFSVIPIIAGTKKPAVEWKRFTERHATDEEIQSWTRHDIGLVMGQISGYVGVDADTKRNARFLFNCLPFTTMVTITPKGGHLLYRLDHQDDDPIGPMVKTTIKGVECDIRGEASYLVAAPSLHPSGKPYRRWGEWKPPPFFDRDWIEKPVELKPTNGVRSIQKYISKIEAVSGKGGHNATFRAACKCRDSGLSESEALAVLMEWNQTNADPPWSIKELLHKVKSVYRREK